MDKDQVKGYWKWFKEYTDSFIENDTDPARPVQLKIDHTRRVVENILTLGRAMGMAGNDLLIAETMALYHDLGRFRQYAVYKTFSDLASENHAKLGIKELALNKTLSNCDSCEKRLILKAIACHNAADLPLNIKDRKQIFYIKLLRDADKLDIWHVVIKYYKERKNGKKKSAAVELGLPDEPSFSKAVLESLCRGEIARIEDVRTLNDFKLLQIGWVFDLNFKPSLRIARDRRIIQHLASTLPADKGIEMAVAHAEASLESRLRQPGALVQGPWE